MIIIGIVLGILVFKLSRDFDWHWSIGLIIALIPIAATWFGGLFGLIPSALFVAALYKINT